MKYLRHLVIPNIDLPPIKVYLDTILSPLLLQMIRFLTTGITFIGMLAALYFVVKGPRLIRFNIFWMCLSFLPFSFFNEQLAVAPRYLYIPSISFSVLLALLVIHIYTAIRNNGWGKRTFLLSSVILIAVFNILPMWVWEIRWQENGMERRSIVSQ
jgi:hypothetical protein